MDSGYVAPDDTLEPDFDISAGLDPSEALWIMDQLMCLEITWHDGYPLSQTIFTSLHIDHLLSPSQDAYDTFFEKSTAPAHFSLEQALAYDVLRAYLTGLIVCCNHALQLIQSQNFYEEEDFVTHLFGRELLPKVDSGLVSNMLDDAIGLLEERQTNHVGSALQARLKFRRNLLNSLANMENYWEDMIAELARIKSSHEHATPIPEAFSEKVQRQLATSTPPRPMLQVSWDLCCRKWKDLYEDIVAAQRFTSPEIIQSPACLQRAVWTFAYRGQPCALARAEIQDILFGDHTVGGVIPHYELLLTDMRDLVLAGDPLVDPQSFQVEVTTDPRHVCSRLMESFMDKAIDEYLNLYRMVCQNRCRIRRTFTQAIPILDTLVTEATMIDEELEKHTTSLRRKFNQATGKDDYLQPLASWTRFYKFRIMEWTIQLGFETEIYMPDELVDMYYFLSHLCAQRNALLETIESFTTEMIRKTNDTNIAAECQVSIELLKCLQQTCQITLNLALALKAFYTMLKSVGVIKAPSREFADPQLLYEARMKPYLSAVNDPIPSLGDFEAAREQVDTVPNMCLEIDEKIKKAKILLSEVKKLTPEQGRYVGTEEAWKKEIKQLETTCVAIAVGASQFRRAFEKYGKDGLKEKMECSPEKRYHEWWVVPQLKEKAK